MKTMLVRPARGLTALAFGLSCLALNHGMAATIETDRPSYAPNQSIVVTFAGGPGNPKDWIGIYRQGTVPGSTPATIWQYVDGTTTGSAGVAGGSVTFGGGLAVSGSWVAFLLEDDGYTVSAQVDFQVVDAGRAPLVYSRHSAYLPLELIELGWENGPGNRLDWIGIYPEGVLPGSVPSTLWFYVDGTQTGSQGLRAGIVTFPDGLALANDYDAHLLENDGYDILASTRFSIVDPSDPLVRSDKRFYGPSEPIVLTFERGWGGVKDWVGIYPANVVPGTQSATLWMYVDGTQTGSSSVVSGSLRFTAGLQSAGDYIAYLLADDGYVVQASERLTVRTAAASGPQVLFVNPSPGSADASPRIEFSATITNRLTRLNPASVVLTLDNETVSPRVTAGDNSFEIALERPGLFAPSSVHTFVLGYRDDGQPPRDYSQTVQFTVVDYRDILLPAPIVFEDFDAVPEGSLPAGWTEENFTDITEWSDDLTNLDSATFGRWIVIDSARFNGNFMTYSAAGSESPVYRRVLSSNLRNVVNGQLLDGPLATGRFLFGNSGYRNVSEPGLGQVLYVFTPDFDLSGHSDIHLSFHSLWEQNQDSIGAVEYSINRGQTWLPIVYMLHGPDIVTMTDPESGQTTIDAVATLSTERGDIARYYDKNWILQGGFYGAFIGANVTQDLAPFISARTDDDPVESKRVEIFRLPAADRQGAVRFRFAHAGTDSWYFGIDNFGLYSIQAVAEAPPLSVQRQGNNIVITWPGAPGGFTLEQTSTLSQPAWSNTPGVSGSSVTIPASGATMFYRLRR
jgi:hypothetical protein